MDSYDVLTICRRYMRLGSSVTDQLDSVVEGNAEDCNTNALALIHEFCEQIVRVAGDDRVGEEFADVRDELERFADEHDLVFRYGTCRTKDGESVLGI